MGLFPKHCKVCDGYFIPYYSDVHCEAVEGDIESLKRNICKDIQRNNQLIRDIIQAYKKQEGLEKAILAAAYDFGYSVSPDRFIWLEDEIERFRKEDEEKRKQKEIKDCDKNPNNT